MNVNAELYRQMMVGKRVAVLGLGVSNVPAIEFLDSCGAVIIACDKTPEEDFDEDILNKIRKKCDEIHLGDEYLDYLDGVDIVLKSPGIKPSLAQIVKAKEAGAVITSEMEIFMSLCPCKIIGVTGSDGKTTTTTLIYQMLSREGLNCFVGGNIGTPLLNKLDEITPNDIVVLELSSFQLMNMTVSPDVAVITNISPNHLDYHRDMSEYVEAKAQIFKNQSKNGRLIVNRDNAITAAFEGKQNGTIEFFSRKYKPEGSYIEDNQICCHGEKIIDITKIRIKGWHNVENYLAAITAVRPYVSNETIVYVAENFGGVEHRMEYVNTHDGVDFYNDSIGSSPSRTIAGLLAHEGRIVLIAGGYDKNLDYDELGKIIKDHVSALVLIGATAEKIEESVKKAYAPSKCTLPIVHQKTYDAAVKGAFAVARSLKKDGIPMSVILSPASASFDMFKNFMVRGDTYKQIVNNLKVE